MLRSDPGGLIATLSGTFQSHLNMQLRGIFMITLRKSVRNLASGILLLFNGLTVYGSQKPKEVSTHQSGRSVEDHCDAEGQWVIISGESSGSFEHPVNDLLIVCHYFLQHNLLQTKIQVPVHGYFDQTFQTFVVTNPAEWVQIKGECANKISEKYQVELPAPVHSKSSQQALRLSYFNHQGIYGAINKTTYGLSKWLWSVTPYSMSEYNQYPVSSESDLEAFKTIHENSLNHISSSMPMPQEFVGYQKYLKYITSLEHTYHSTDRFSSEWNWFDEIRGLHLPGQGSLILGGLPLISEKYPLRNYLAKLSEINIDAVLSLNEPFELSYGTTRHDGSNNVLFDQLTPVPPETWKRLKVAQKIIPTPDFLPVSPDLIEEGVKYIHRYLSQGKKIYVHCKAGRGRSVTVVAAYLIKYHLMSPDQAIEYIRQFRPHISLNESQKAAIYEYNRQLII